MPYHLIALVTSIALGLWFVAFADVSVRAKAAVGSAVVASLVIELGFPRWNLAATLLQVVVSIVVLVHSRLGR